MNFLTSGLFNSEIHPEELLHLQIDFRVSGFVKFSSKFGFSFAHFGVMSVMWDAAFVYEIIL